MLLRLRKEICKCILPYRMSKLELEQYEEFNQIFSDGYAEKLKKLYEDILLKDCQECIGYILQNRIKIEQEAMLT